MSGPTTKLQTTAEKPQVPINLAQICSKAKWIKKRWPGAKAVYSPLRKKSDGSLIIPPGNIVHFTDPKKLYRVGGGGTLRKVVEE